MRIVEIFRRGQRPRLRALSTGLGWAWLKSDPTLIVGSAFFVIGFDPHATRIAGLARAIGILAGRYLGYWLSLALGSGPMLDLVVLSACFLSFATMGIHPGAMMFFLLVMIAAGWGQIAPEQLDLIASERFLGEILGVVIAFSAVAYLEHWLQRRSADPKAATG